MITHASKPCRVLAVDPTSRGFGFAVLECPKTLVDYGVSQVTSENKNHATLAAVRRLIEWYHPAVLVLEDCASRGSRRSQRVRRLIRQLKVLAAKTQLRCCLVPWRRLRETATGLPTATKHQVAKALTQVFPELGRRLPPARRPWMSEDARASIFDAVALAAAYFYAQAKRHRPIV